MTREWAAALLALGYPPELALEFDRLDGHVVRTLGGLAAQPPGSAWPSFRFALDDAVVSDNRIPPYGMDHLAARERNCLPVPEDQFGGPGGTYEAWVDVPLDPPSGAASASISLYYLPTSWEYVQFLRLANDGSVGFLAQEGVKLFEAWKATGMAAPVRMASTTWGADCDPHVTAFCTAKTNSAGCEPQLGINGLPTLSGADEFHVVVTQAIGQQTGLLQWSLAAAPLAAPFGGAAGRPPLSHSPRGGFSCLSGAHVLGTATSGGTAFVCDGVLDFPIGQAFFVQQGLLAGTEVYVQAWYGDPAHPDGSGIGHTAGMSFTLCP